MSNKDSLIIHPSGEVISPTDLPSNVIVFDEEKRQKVIQILRQIPAFLDSAKKLSKGKTYKAIIDADIMIDDHFKNLDLFKGTTILFTQPHNQLKNDGRHKRTNSWQEIASILL